MTLEETAKKIRRYTLNLLYRAQTCHLGSNMSVVEILVALYFKVMEEDDIFISSKGWCAAALYSVLAEKGIIHQDELFNYFEKYHLISHEVPGIIFGTGSGGQGLPVAVGMALADRRRKVYCLMSDGEMQEGTTWEAAMFAAHHKLDNLVVIVDYNDLQAFGRIEEVVNIANLKQKWESFNWDAREVNGHDCGFVRGALLPISKPFRKPLVVIADTIKGKGVSFAEDKLEWHYNSLSKEQYEQAIKENH